MYETNWEGGSVQEKVGGSPSERCFFLSMGKVGGEKVFTTRRGRPAVGRGHGAHPLARKPS